MEERDGETTWTTIGDAARAVLGSVSARRTAEDVKRAKAKERAREAPALRDMGPG